MDYAERKAARIFFMILLGAIVPIICTVKSIRFKQDCSGYLKQAADANTVEIALDRIDHALQYIETHNLTSGYTSVIWRTEDENVGFWYQNICACRNELADCINASALEKSNVLMRVRESLTDQGEEGTVLTIPEGIHKYPNNGLWGVLLFISIVLLVFGFGVLFAEVS